MNNDLFMSFLKKKHHNLTSLHGSGDDYPIVFSGQIQNSTKKNVYKVGHDLKIKSHEVKEIKKSDKDEKILLAKSLNIGYYLITPLLVGVFFGFWLDNVFRTKPIFLLSFFSLGVIGAFYNLWKTVQENK